MGHTSEIRREHVERPAGDHQMAIREAEGYRMLQDPVAFARNMARTVESHELEDVLVRDMPRQVEDQRDEFELLIDQAVARGDLGVLRDVMDAYSDFTNGAYNESRDYGIALGAVMEQFRAGLVEVVGILDRGMSHTDVSTRMDLQRLRLKHDLPGKSAVHRSEEEMDAAAD